MAVEHLWPVMIRQQVINGWLSLLLWLPAGVFLAVSGVIVARAGWKRRLNELKRERWTDVGTPQLMIGIVAVLIGTIIAITGLHFGISHLLNPEYHALSALMRMR